MQLSEGLVSPLHIPAWRGFPLRDRLASALDLHAVLDNDAKAFALGESMFGAGRGARSMLGIIVSTGVGGGIVAGGRLMHGATWQAGHIGHVIVVPEGARCPCGALGCVTAYASGTGLAARAVEELDGGADSKLSSLPRHALTAAAIAEAAADGDGLAGRLLEDAGRALGRGIASAAALLDLDLVVIGGGVSQAGDLLFLPLLRELRERARLDFTRDLQVVPAQLGQHAGVVGAAALAIAAI